MKPRSRLALEPLEARLAPAVIVSSNGRIATFTDVDGDAATVKVSKGTLTPGLFATAPTGPGRQQLQRINLTSGGLDGANLTITAKRSPTGDGLVNVGYINSTGHDLGLISIAGDLGQIDVGDGDSAAPALKALTVQSLGRYGTDTQGGGDLRSDIIGALGSLIVKGDIIDALVYVNNGAEGTIGSLTIGGSLIGGWDVDTAHIVSTGDMGLVKIGHDVRGGKGNASGLIQCFGNLAGVRIGGSLVGGSFAMSGEIVSSGDMGMVKIGHDVQGAPGASSGRIKCGGNLAGVSIGGSLIGGSRGLSGEIISGGDMGMVKIAHDVLGGSGLSGRINANGNLAGVSIGGSLIGGSGSDAGVISSGGDMGAVRIAHDVRGGSGPSTGIIHSSMKLAGVSIGGSLVGGSNSNSGGIDSSGDMGAVKIGYDLRGGSGSDSGYIVSNAKLASVSIGGSLIGGSKSVSGEIFSIGDMGAVKIGHDLVGASLYIAESSLSGSGLIQTTAGRIASVWIGGSIISGLDISDDGDLTKNASVRAADDLGSLTVKGSLIGHATIVGVSPVIITARGQAFPVAGRNLAIGKIAVGGRVEHALILAGYDTNLYPNNADAQIGAVTVGGDWVASNMAAGVLDGGNGFGNSFDVKIGGAGGGGGPITNEPETVSKIASITIKGRALGTPNSTDSSDHYGFVAQQVGTVTIGGRRFALEIREANDIGGFAVGVTGDLRVREVAL